MKTRLLRKVRKRFSIIRIDIIASNASCIEIEMASDGLPFFRVFDSEGWMEKSWDFRTYDMAYDYLRKKIRWIYFEKFKHRDEVSQKVWHGNKK